MTPSYKLGVASIFVSLLIGCAKEEPKPSEPVIPPVKVQVVERDPSEINAKIFNGVAEGIDDITISFRVAGTLNTMPGRVGDIRKKGEVIATLDTRDFNFSVSNLEGQLETAEAEMDVLQSGARREDILKLEAKLLSFKSTFRTSQLEYQRVQQLYANDAASKARLDTAKADMDLAEANLKAEEQEYQIALTGGREEDIRAQTAKMRSIKANLDQAIADRYDTTLRMPYDGVISIKHTSNFEEIKKGEEIYDVVALDRIEVKISIPDTFISYVKKGQTVQTEFLPLPDKKYQGKVTKVGLAADKATLTYPVWVEIPNPKREILAGMSAEVSMQFQGMAASLPLLPIHSVIEDKVSKSRYVWLFDPETSTAKRRNISIGKIEQNEIEVIQGINKGDTVIVAGLDRLIEGMEVRLYKKENPSVGETVMENPEPSKEDS
jgi:multidrug efflux pump subunit AcrA (membrane-fusion protein)